MPATEKIYPTRFVTLSSTLLAKKPVNFVGLPDEALIRLPDVLRLYPGGRTRWLKGVADREYPQPIKISKRIVAWQYGEIKKLLRSMRG